MKQPRYEQSPLREIDPNEEFKNLDDDITSNVLVAFVVVSMLCYLAWQLIKVFLK